MHRRREAVCRLRGRSNTRRCSYCHQKERPHHGAETDHKRRLGWREQRLEDQSRGQHGDRTSTANCEPPLARTHQNDRGQQRPEIRAPHAPRADTRPAKTAASSCSLHSRERTTDDISTIPMYRAWPAIGPASNPAIATGTRATRTIAADIPSSLRDDRRVRPSVVGSTSPPARSTPSIDNVARHVPQESVPRRALRWHSSEPCSRRHHRADLSARQPPVAGTNPFAVDQLRGSCAAAHSEQRPRHRRHLAARGREACVRAQRGAA